LRLPFFQSIEGQVVRRIGESCGLQRRSDAKASFVQLVRAMAAQAICGVHSLGFHLRLVSGLSISDSAVIAMRASLTWEFFAKLLARLLRPLAKPEQQPESFYEGMRLLALDGTNWSLRNSAAVLERPQRSRHSNQHGACAAFFKMGSAVLLEIGTHQPLALACESAHSPDPEGELTIARRTLGSLPKDKSNLLLADRLYGNASFMLDVLEASEQHTQLLVRVRSNLKGKLLKVLSDGSVLLEVCASGKGVTQGKNKLMVREIRARVQYAGSKALELRLWTTLLDEKKHPSAELAVLYAQRWEQELFYRELKHHVGASSLLKAHSEQAAQGELVGLILAASIVAQRRVATGQHMELPPLRLSLRKIGYLLEGLCLLLHAGKGIMSEKQAQALSKRVFKIMARESVIPPRKARRCKRGVRRALSPWPVVRSREKLDSSCEITLVPHS
jgi:hypothetical protein